MPTGERFAPAIRGATLAAMLVSLGTARAAWADPPVFLPEAFARFEGARYVPGENEQVWTTWIGAGADLLKAGPVTFEFTGDVETIIGNELRTFDPNQANYHLAGAARIAVGGDELMPFFHHVSRHVVDRPKLQAVDWNLVGVRARVTFAGERGWVLVGVGHTLGDTSVGYGWELTGRTEWEPVRGVYAAAEVRHVTAEPVPLFPRGSFTDLSFEGGARWRSGPRSIDLFGAFERRNDVFVQAPGVRDRLLLGFRIGPAGRTRVPR